MVLGTTEFGIWVQRSFSGMDTPFRHVDTQLAYSSIIKIGSQVLSLIRS